MADKRRLVFVSRLILVILSLAFVNGRKHHLHIETDSRKQFTLSSFGFLKHGTLTVNVTNFIRPKEDATSSTYGFTLDVTSNSGASGYMQDYTEKCIFDEEKGGIEDVKKNTLSVIFFKMDFQNKKLLIERRGKSVQNLIITNQTFDTFWKSRPKRALSHDFVSSGLSDSYLFVSHDFVSSRLSDSYLFGNKVVGPREKRAVDDDPPKPKKGSLDNKDDSANKDVKPTEATPPEGSDVKKPPEADAEAPENENGTATEGDKPDNIKAKTTAAPPFQIISVLPMTVDREFYSFYFLVAVTDAEQEGMYTLTFHSCDKDDNSVVSFLTDIVEVNDNGNYLSASIMPLPTLFFALSVVYMVMGVVWNTVLCKSKDPVYKMHYLMLVVVFVKSLACLFHAINYHFIRKEGIHEEAWAVLFYIAYLTRGALLFVTIILIGAGWAFIKHVLSDREKKLFLIVIPLQILDNIAWIIVEESEEGESQYTTWKEIFILIDLLCCGAILFPVVWSIKHLQEASQADGKEMLSLTKLKLFRQFYIMVVCYIYFTRIIVYLLKMTVPFKYEWLNELFRELATILFFVVTAYKFKPAEDNPYLKVPTEEEEELEMDEVIVSQSASLDTVKKVNQGNRDNGNGTKLRESSHEYD